LADIETPYASLLDPVAKPPARKAGILDFRSRMRERDGLLNSLAGGGLRIVEAALWDRDYLDLVEPACLQIGNDGWAEFAFGAVSATAELEYGRCIVFFRWSGFDERDEISVDGSAEVQNDGSIEIVLSFDDGDDAILTARHE
jgi:hypothetical protein